MRAAPPTDRDPDWRDAGACRSEDPDIFFATSLTGPGRRDVEQAKAACRRCPSAEACLTYALENGINDGIFGGLDEYERSKLRRREARNTRRQRAATKAAV